MENKPSDWLSRVAQDESLANFTSQRGEDRILQKIFEMIGVKARFCVEFGAADGKRGSNTWHWVHDENWGAVQIEPKRDQDLNLRQKRDTFEALEKRYKDNPKVTCLNEMVGWEGENSLDNLLAKTDAPKEFDLLSIDIDSEDYRVWEGLKNFHPRVVVIEHNKTVPIDVSFASSSGTGLRAFYELAKEKGYELVAATIVNGIFVRKEDFDKFEIEDNDPAKVWPEHMDFVNNMWQMYDGTVVVSGPEKLRWVRGADGTLAGQLKSGNFRWMQEGKMFGPGKGGYEKSLISGRLRHYIYKVLDKI